MLPIMLPIFVGTLMVVGVLAGREEAGTSIVANSRSLGFGLRTGLFGIAVFLGLVLSRSTLSR